MGVRTDEFTGGVVVLRWNGGLAEGSKEPDVIS